MISKLVMIFFGNIQQANHLVLDGVNACFFGAFDFHTCQLRKMQVSIRARPSIRLYFGLFRSSAMVPRLPALLLYVITHCEEGRPVGADNAACWMGLHKWPSPGASQRPPVK